MKATSFKIERTPSQEELAIENVAYKILTLLDGTNVDVARGALKEVFKLLDTNAVVSVARSKPTEIEKADKTPQSELQEKILWKCHEESRRYC